MFNRVVDIGFEGSDPVISFGLGFEGNVFFDSIAGDLVRFFSQICFGRSDASW